MENTWIFAAFFMGLAGSIHCLGMCGPLLFAVSGFYNSPKEMIRPQIFYHAGKLITYAMLGVALGFVGQTFALFDIQRNLLLVSGFILLMAGLFGIFIPIPMKTIEQIVVQKMGSLLQKRSGGPLILGFLNGLVPCGLVYAAAIGAMATQTWWQGSLFMLFFGLGTAPILIAAAYSRWMIKFRPVLAKPIWKQMPAVLLGLFLFVKGLGLGIPFISPNLNKPQPHKNCCLQKQTAAHKP